MGVCTNGVHCSQSLLSMLHYWQSSGHPCGASKSEPHVVPPLCHIPCNDSSHDTLRTDSALGRPMAAYVGSIHGLPVDRRSPFSVSE